MFRKTETSKKFFTFQEETEALKSVLHFRKWNFLSPSPKDQKNPPWKKFMIFQKMELSSSNTKKILIFPEMKPCTFRTRSSKSFPKKPALKKHFYIFSKRLLIFRNRKPPRSSLYFKKWKFLALILKYSYISWNETLHFSA